MKDVLSDRHNENDDYETPAYIFDPLHEVFHFTLDVCATLVNAKVPNFISPEQNGFTTPWGDNRCWCNPPYSQMKLWAPRMYEQSAQGALVVALLPGRADTIPWHDIIWPMARVIVPMYGRIKFVGCTDVAKLPNALAVFSLEPLTAEQMMVLVKYGPIVQTVMRYQRKEKKKKCSR